MKQPAIFLDRDGTLIEEVNFLSRVEDLRLFEFSAAAVSALKDAGFLVIVVTNQSGIGRGIFTESAMHDIHNRIQSELLGAIDAFYFCPHLPDEGCRCRKPGLGMIETAQSDFEIDLKRSWMVGDKAIDIATGISGNLSTAMVLTGYGTEHQAALEVQPTIITDHFGRAAEEIVKKTNTI